jgi:hypothetical protein
MLSPSYISFCTGFTASSGIVNVSIPTTSDNVQPLQSVNGWLVIMSRMDGTFPLNQTWETYKTGFGNNTLNFWLGLERIYQLTNSAVNGGITYRIRFLLQSLKHRK